MGCDLSKTSTPSSIEEPVTTTNENSNLINSSSSSSGLTKFEQKILDLHNKYRNDNGIPSLEWDTTLSDKAKKWNEFLKVNESCAMRHPINSKYEKDTFIPNNMGQNLYTRVGNFESNPIDDAISAVQNWWNECVDYDKTNSNPKPQNFDKVGHFTQVAWKDATKLGCHHINCNNSDNNEFKTLITCNYDKGNVENEFNTQVIYTKCPLTLAD